MRVGYGYDLHRLEPGPPLRIGGVLVPSDRGAVGHSDGDVLMHAVVDALVGAAAAGDIGRLFPDTDPRYAGAASREFVTEAARVVHAAGWEVLNVDASVILESPKLAPYFGDMQRNLADALGIDVARVSVKAKTNEGQDAIGAGDAVACHAVALLMAAGSDSGRG